MYRYVRGLELRGRKIDMGVYVNPDEIAKALREKGTLDLAAFGVLTTERRFRSFAFRSGLLPAEGDQAWFIASYGWERLKLTVKDGDHAERLSQIVAQFLVHELIRLRMKFSFETVFSHRSKIEAMVRASKAGFKVYLYFIATNDPELNKDRVRTRVAEGGHDVPPDRIEQRYHRSLELLKEAVARSYHAFMFDNSGVEQKMFAEYKNQAGRPFWWMDLAGKPAWFDQHYLARVAGTTDPDAFEAMNRAAIAWALRS